jgi:hypothetical protein
MVHGKIRKRLKDAAQTPLKTIHLLLLPFPYITILKVKRTIATINVSGTRSQTRVPKFTNMRLMK